MAKFQPRSDDEVAAWLKRRRDEYTSAIQPDTPLTHSSSLLSKSIAIDGLLDEYRMHCATGTALDEDTGEP